MTEKSGVGRVKWQSNKLINPLSETPLSRMSATFKRLLLKLHGVSKSVFKILVIE